MCILCNLCSLCNLIHSVKFVLQMGKTVRYSCWWLIFEKLWIVHGSWLMVRCSWFIVRGIKFLISDLRFERLRSVHSWPLGRSCDSARVFIPSRTLLRLCGLCVQTEEKNAKDAKKRRRKVRKGEARTSHLALFTYFGTCSAAGIQLRRSGMFVARTLWEMFGAP